MEKTDLTALVNRYQWALGQGKDEREGARYSLSSGIEKARLEGQDVSSAMAVLHGQAIEAWKESGTDPVYIRGGASFFHGVTDGYVDAGDYVMGSDGTVYRHGHPLDKSTADKIEGGKDCSQWLVDEMRAVLDAGKKSEMYINNVQFDVNGNIADDAA